jgi:NADH-quinone oxidoreductase subunit N
VSPAASVTALGNVASLRYVVPEIALALAPLLILAWDLFVPKAHPRARVAGVFTIALTALGVAALLSFLALVGAPRLPPLPALLFGGQLACDGFACGFRLLFALVTAFVLVAAIPTREAAVEANGRGGSGAEFVALVLVVCLGMNLMAMAQSLLLVYLAIEMVSVVSFVLVGFRPRESRSHEAALKYVVYGGVASGVMAYGMSWLFGLARSLSLPDISERALAMTRDQGHLPTALAIGVACVTAGFAYKIAAVPFHMWAPDVYEGGPTLVSAFLSVGPKAAGFAVLLRVFREAFFAGTPLPEAEAPWPILAGVLAVATMTLGNLSALGQSNLKRILAYSSIAHSGTMLLAFSLFDDEGIAAIAFYLVAYAAMNLGAFLAVFAVSEAIGDETVEGIRGLGSRAPGMAAALTIFLFSLVGLPPFAGFVGKLYVFVALLRAPGDYRAWYAFLAAAGAINTALSLFYYARILRAMYLLPVAEEGRPVSVRPLHAVMTALLVAPTLLLGVWWGPLYDFLSRTVTMIP